MGPTNVTFPISPSGQIIPYNYSIDYSPVKGIDVLKEFTQSCRNYGIKNGFYYTVTANTWLNVENGFVRSILLSCIILSEMKLLFRYKIVL